MSEERAKPVALVTGGSQGIGRAVAEMLASRGYALAIVALDSPHLAETAKALQERTEALALPADLSNTAAAPGLIAATAERFGRIDALVNCAGATRRGTINDLSDDDWRHGFAVKFFGTVAVTRAAWPHLAKAKGAVITIAGALAHSPSESSMIGGTICSALLNFNKALAETGRRDGVRVNAINPGWIDTGRLDSMLDQRAGKAGHDDRARAAAEMIDELKILRFGQPGDVANLIAFLLSDAGSFIHGAALDIDGGMTKGL
ncbi:SDR family NAD(P)-dependent oxidoreductase [Mameliella alba]|uniref:SDR family NAD(P)-dependent oxidoreductase n=1 Tax=Mameliella alba TaxID=561184 RepID=UPI000B52BBE4|nr:SDR family oxidoreductase [Mameliella alba]OWV46255.1 short-chain dehydrogenase [Mameliella alba]GGF74872.1 short-chain dehydrogenase [Mameliella alba]